MMARAWAKCCCHVHGSISPEMWGNQRFGYGEIVVNRIPSTSWEVLYGRSWILAGTSEHSCMLKHICQWKVRRSCDLHFTCMYYLCYVIVRSATISKKSSIIRLVYKPFILSPHSFTAHTPLYFFGQRCFLYHLIATVSSAILVQASPVDLSSITSRSGGLAQVTTQSTVPGTGALTFNDVRALLLAYPIYIY